ncbi:MAG: response regulator transcription factor [Actinomycetota bacterium]|nr:response regulator transcription factor [Actinomycetota bacterium]
MGSEEPAVNGPARLVLVDDNDLARESLRDMLEDEPAVEVVGEASCGRDAISVCAELRPDLVLMDIRMPGMDGLEATRQIKQEDPTISVLMVTMHEDPDYLFEALRAGAAGYVLKDATQDEMISAVLGVLSGDSSLDPDLAAKLLRRLVDEAQDQSVSQEQPTVRPEHQPLQPLTPRELEVLGYVALGYTNRRIAEELFISVGTVKNHVEHTIAKLGVSDRTQAAVRCYELGIIKPPER